MAKGRESKQALIDRTGRILAQLERTYPDVECALEHTSPYELLAATILSAQCTDERVNMVTPGLFKAYPTPAHLAKARQEDVEALVKSTGFFRNKAANLIGMAQAVVEKHHGEIPQTLEELVALPGVGRKTANVLLGTFHGVPSGVVVDTHVQRISRLLGLAKGNNAETIERELMAIVPQHEWIMLSHRLIHHGRQICIARRPQCTRCPLLADCRRVGLPELEMPTYGLDDPAEPQETRPSKKPSRGKKTMTKGTPLKGTRKATTTTTPLVAKSKKNIAKTQNRNGH